jgi:glycosyltransferase involved in cell wall biosynthesis
MPRALLLFEPPDGGAPEVVLNLALGMEHHGWNVLVAGPRDASICARLEAEGVQYVPLPALRRSWRSPLADARALRGLEALLKRERVDVIHCHSSKAGVLGRLAGRRRGIPVVYTPHCFAFLRDLGALARLLPASVERLLAPLTSAYVCVCDSEREEVLKHRLAPRERTHRIYNGVRAPEAQISTERALQDFKGDGLLVGAVTVLRPQKRLDVLIEAIPAVLAREPRARFAIVGNGPMRGQLQAQAAALGLDEEPRFAFFPFRPPSGRYMSVLDLYVLSSAWEAMPMGVLEALAWGVPQVVSEVGGTAEAVSSKTGRLVPAKQAATLAEAIVEMLSSPTALAAAGAASRARHRERFDAQRMVSETVGVYASVVAGMEEPAVAREERAMVALKARA